MNIKLLIDELLKIGKTFYITKKDDSQLSRSLVTEFKSRGVATVYENLSEYNGEPIDVEIILDGIESHHAPSSCCKLMLNNIRLDNINHKNLSDYIVWNDRTGKLLVHPQVGEFAIERGLFERMSGLSHFATYIFKERLTSLSDFYTKKKIFPIYAGPIGENSFLRLNTLNLVSLMKEAFNHGYEKIFFLNPDEGLQHIFLEKAHRLSKLFMDRHPYGTFFYVTASTNCNSAYKLWCKEHNTVPCMVIITDLEFENSAKGNGGIDSTLYKYKLNKISSPDYTTPRPKKYINLNRMPRPHRGKLLYRLIKNNYLEQGFNSFDPEFNNRGVWDAMNNELNNDATPEEMRNMNQTLIKYKDIFPLVVNRTKERDNPTDIRTDDIDYTKQCYFSIVTETNFYSDKAPWTYGAFGGHNSPYFGRGSTFLSEKIFKPLVTGQPFILFGEPGHLKQLQNMGYETFSQWFNEDYDSIENDDERFDAAFNEVARIMEWSDQKWLDTLAEMHSTIYHNFSLIHSLNKVRNLTDCNYMQYFN